MEGPKEFFDAVYGRDAEKIRRLVNALGPVVDGSDGARAMRSAVDRGYHEILLAFLGAGVNPNVRDGDGSSPLMWVAHTGNSGLARELLRLGAEPNAADNVRWTALFHASAAQDLEMVTLLLEAGADVTARDFEGNTAVEIARTRPFKLNVPFLGFGSGRYPTFFDTPVRALLRAHLAQSGAPKRHAER